ncbi:MAG TPA: hypothetical protein VMD47_11205 [Candidatus Acidoferrales bacterium]|nr:hypothetical protein [Candidatus Acidoferrales bacterium]
MAVTVELVRCLEPVRDLYRRPLGFERFQAYLDLVRAGTGTEALPLSQLNPMAKPHALEYVEALLAFDAERVASSAAAQAGAKLTDADDALRVIVVPMDDAMGGWTNRAFAEFSHRYERKYEVPRGWATVVVWTSETPTPQLVAQRTFETVYRTVDERRRGAVRTLREILDREGRTMRFAEHQRLYDDQTIRSIRRKLEPLLDSHAAPIVFAALYGDEIAASLGYPPLGIPERGGYELALAGAAKAEKGSLEGNVAARSRK